MDPTYTPSKLRAIAEVSLPNEVASFKGQVMRLLYSAAAAGSLVKDIKHHNPEVLSSVARDLLAAGFQVRSANPTTILVSWAKSV